MSIRGLNDNIKESLLKGDSFAYAHLVKFEKPIKTVTGAVSENARDYSYLTDASHNINFDDGNGIFRVRVGLGANVILSSNSYN